jgi:hypothetical protein
MMIEWSGGRITDKIILCYSNLAEVIPRLNKASMQGPRFVEVQPQLKDGGKIVI